MHMEAEEHFAILNNSFTVKHNMYIKKIFHCC